MDTWQRQVYDKLVRLMENVNVDATDGIHEGEVSPVMFSFNSKEVYVIKRVFEEQFVFLKKPGVLVEPPKEKR